MDIYLVRHGETDLNRAKVYYGAMDVPLNENGRIQARAVGRCLEGIVFDKVYISSKLRTHQTALEILKPEMETSGAQWCQEASGTKKGESGMSGPILADPRISVLAGLDEMNFGSWEGLDYHQVQARYPSAWDAWCKDWLNTAPGGGECFCDFFNRVSRAFERVLKEAKSRRWKNILICGHNGPLRVILAVMCGLGPEGIWHFNFDQDAYSMVEEQWEHFTVGKMNCKDKAGFTS